MEALVETLKQTPWWVYLLFIYFMMMGIKAMKDSSISIKKLFILPILFIYWSISNLESNDMLSGSPFSKYLIFGAIGIVLGYFLYGRLMESYNIKTKRFHTQGSIQTLIIFILIFACKYTFGYLIATDPSILQNIDFRWVYLVIEGVISGLYVGRVLNGLYVRAKGPYVNQ